MILTWVISGWQGLIHGGDTLPEILAAGIWLLFVGLLFSVVSQMGFLAYLMIHRFGLGIFKPRLWNWVQLVLIAFVLFDLVYLRHISFSEQNESWTQFIALPLILLIIGVVTAIVKAKLTNHKAFIPALFFIVVVTTLEAIPTILQNDSNWVTLMTATLLTCNVWQVLVIQRLTKVEENKHQGAS